MRPMFRLAAFLVVAIPWGAPADARGDALRIDCSSA